MFVNINQYHKYNIFMGLSSIEHSGASLCSDRNCWRELNATWILAIFNILHYLALNWEIELTFKFKKQSKINVGLAFVESLKKVDLEIRNSNSVNLLSLRIKFSHTHTIQIHISNMNWKEAHSWILNCAQACNISPQSMSSEHNTARYTFLASKKKKKKHPFIP